MSRKKSLREIYLMKIKKFVFLACAGEVNHFRDDIIFQVRKGLVDTVLLTSVRFDYGFFDDFVAVSTFGYEKE